MSSPYYGTVSSHAWPTGTPTLDGHTVSMPDSSSRSVERFDRVEGPSNIGGIPCNLSLPPPPSLLTTTHDVPRAFGLEGTAEPAAGMLTPPSPVDGLFRVYRPPSSSFHSSSPPYASVANQAAGVVEQAVGSVAPHGTPLGDTSKACQVVSLSVDEPTNAACHTRRYRRILPKIQDSPDWATPDLAEPSANSSTIPPPTAADADPPSRHTRSASDPYAQTSPQQQTALGSPFQEDYRVGQGAATPGEPQEDSRCGPSSSPTVPSSLLLGVATPYRRIFSEPEEAASPLNANEEFCSTPPATGGCGPRVPVEPVYSESLAPYPLVPYYPKPVEAKYGGVPVLQHFKSSFQLLLSSPSTSADPASPVRTGGNCKGKQRFRHDQYEFTASLAEVVNEPTERPYEMLSPTSPNLIESAEPPAREEPWHSAPAAMRATPPPDLSPSPVLVLSNPLGPDSDIISNSQPFPDVCHVDAMPNTLGHPEEQDAVDDYGNLLQNNPHALDGPYTLHSASGLTGVEGCEPAYYSYTQPNYWYATEGPVHSQITDDWGAFREFGTIDNHLHPLASSLQSLHPQLPRNRSCTSSLGNWDGSHPEMN